MNGLNKIIANNIQNLRKSAGYTQLQFAEKLNYSDKAVSKWERGESVPDIHILKQIADMFSVTVDYLLSESHDEKPATEDMKKTIRNNRFIITLLATSVVWLVATVAYVVLGIYSEVLTKEWLAFVVAVPTSCIVLLVFNSIWGRTKLNFLIISVLVWSMLIFLFLLLEFDRIWLIFVTGIPAQIIIILWSRIKRLKQNS